MGSSACDGIANQLLVEAVWKVPETWPYRKISPWKGPNSAHSEKDTSTLKATNALDSIPHHKFLSTAKAHSLFLALPQQITTKTLRQLSTTTKRPKHLQLLQIFPARYPKT